jgi:protein-disulfide isomerase
MAKDNRSARDRAAAARAADQAAERRKRQWLIIGGVVLVAAAAVGIGFSVQSRTAASNTSLGTGPVIAPSGSVGTAALAIPFGANPAARAVLTIYEDFRCPFCKAAEATFEPTYTSFANQGRLRVEYHIVNLIDRNLGGTGSIRSGSAAGCAQDAGKFEPYHDLLYANQPDETDDAYGSSATLIALAKKVPGLDSPAFEGCVNATRHGSWVIENFNALSTLLQGAVSTPYYAVNGKQFPITEQPTPAQQASFKSTLEAAIVASG